MRRRAWGLLTVLLIAVSSLSLLHQTVCDARTDFEGDEPDGPHGASGECDVHRCRSPVEFRDLYELVYRSASRRQGQDAHNARSHLSHPHPHIHTPTHPHTHTVPHTRTHTHTPTHIRVLFLLRCVCDGLRCDARVLTWHRVPFCHEAHSSQLSWGTPCS
eukprot:1131503-Rhodomonas_salina.2